MCISESRLYAKRADGRWYESGHRSMHRARVWSEAIEPGDGWDDVAAALQLGEATP
jgi:hypothetical protein